MSDTSKPPEEERFGCDVLGPIMAEFCLRLWSLTVQLGRPDDTALLFCARGGLRMQMIYDRFLSVSGLKSPVPTAPLMVSRLVALRSSLWRTARTGAHEIGPAASEAISYEFSHRELGDLVRALTGYEISDRWDGPATPERLGQLIAHPDGRPITRILRMQAEYFEQHLAGVLAGRTHAILVDTGLYGTTCALLTEGIRGTEFSSALIARSFRQSTAGEASRKSTGISVAAASYSPFSRRTALLRYWHFIEWFLEPKLDSVRWFDTTGAKIQSNLEVVNWQEQIKGETGTAFSGVLRYLDTLPSNPGVRVINDTRRAWTQFRRTVVWPSPSDGLALKVGVRSHDFGLDGTWSERSVSSPIAALRGSSMWREGQIARTRSPLRIPLLAAIETAYGARLIKRAILARLRQR